MIRMEEKQKIIKMWEFDRKSIRQISRDLGVNHKIVVRYVDSYKRAKATGTSSGPTVSDYLLTTPVFANEAPQSLVMLFYLV